MAENTGRKVGEMAYGLFGAVGKSIRQRQEKQCQASGLKFNPKTGRCDEPNKTKK